MLPARDFLRADQTKAQADLVLAFGDQLEHSTVGSQTGSHHHPTQGDSEPTEAFENRH